MCKTTLCTKNANSLGFIHKSASQLIREAKATAIAQHGKAVSDIPGNQQLLIDAVRGIALSGHTLLLDGHLALFNSARKAAALPTKVFADLGIDGLVLLHDTPEKIVDRLK